MQENRIVVLAGAERMADSPLTILRRNVGNKCLVCMLIAGGSPLQSVDVEFPMQQASGGYFISQVVCFAGTLYNL